MPELTRTLLAINYVEEIISSLNFDEAIAGRRPTKMVPARITML